ncbi:MAG: hypothetical protein HYY30_10475 [Chloroflexi bacterium]|nr:hypothetical protein [Chloroflexota bacterium]
MRNGMVRLIALIGILTLGLAVIAGCTQAAKTQTAAEYYKGKTVIWVVSSSAGGGTDLLARAIAPYLGKEIGATIRIENDASDAGVNAVYNDDKKDGLTFVIKSSNAMSGNDILKAPGTEYSIDKFNFLGDLHPGATVFNVSPQKPYKTIDDLKKAKGLKGAASSARGSLTIGASVMAEVLALDAKVITGYDGNKNVTLALGRGEADYQVTSDGGAKQDRDAGYVNTLFIVGEDRSSVLPEVPTMIELGAKVPKELETAFGFISAMGYVAAMPPGVPQDRVEYVRTALDNLSNRKDKALVDDVSKALDGWAPFMPGKKVQEKMNALKADKNLAGTLESLVKKYSAALQK